MGVPRSFIHRVFCSVALLAVLSVPIVALAVDPPADGTTTELTNPLGTTVSLQGVIGNVIRAGFGVIGSIALLMFMYGGFLWLTSGGATDKIKKGQDTMVWAALGIAVVFAGYAITTFVINALTKS